MSLQALTVIFDSLILSKITYALPAIAGHIYDSVKTGSINNARHIVEDLFLRSMTLTL